MYSPLPKRALVLCGVEFAADNESGVESCRAEDGGGQAGGRGFAVRTGNGDAVTEAHQLCQHQGARNNGNLPLQRSDNFGIFFLDGGRGNDDIRTVNVFCGMVRINLNAGCSNAR